MNGTCSPDLSRLDRKLGKPSTPHLLGLMSPERSRKDIAVPVINIIDSSPTVEKSVQNKFITGASLKDNDGTVLKTMPSSKNVELLPDVKISESELKQSPSPTLPRRSTSPYSSSSPSPKSFIPPIFGSPVLPRHGVIVGNKPLTYKDSKSSLSTIIKRSSEADQRDNTMTTLTKSDTVIGQPSSYVVSQNRSIFKPGLDSVVLSCSPPQRSHTMTPPLSPRFRSTSPRQPLSMSMHSISGLSQSSASPTLSRKSLSMIDRDSGRNSPRPLSSPLTLRHSATSPTLSQSPTQITQKSNKDIFTYDLISRRPIARFSLGESIDKTEDEPDVEPETKPLAVKQAKPFLLDDVPKNRMSPGVVKPNSADMLDHSIHSGYIEKTKDTMPSKFAVDMFHDPDKIQKVSLSPTIADNSSSSSSQSFFSDTDLSVTSTSDVSPEILRKSVPISSKHQNTKSPAWPDFSPILPRQKSVSLKRSLGNLSEVSEYPLSGNLSYKGGNLTGSNPCLGSQSMKSDYFKQSISGLVSDIDNLSNPTHTDISTGRRLPYDTVAVSKKLDLLPSSPHKNAQLDHKAQGMPPTKETLLSTTDKSIHIHTHDSDPMPLHPMKAVALAAHSKNESPITIEQPYCPVKSTQIPRPETPPTPKKTAEPSSPRLPATEKHSREVDEDFGQTRKTNESCENKSDILTTIDQKQSSKFQNYVINRNISKESQHTEDNEGYVCTVFDPQPHTHTVSENQSYSEVKAGEVDTRQAFADTAQLKQRRDVKGILSSSEMKEDNRKTFHTLSSPSELIKTSRSPSGIVMGKAAIIPARNSQAKSSRMTVGHTTGTQSPIPFSGKASPTSVSSRINPASPTGKTTMSEATGTTSRKKSLTSGLEKATGTKSPIPSSGKGVNVKGGKSSSVSASGQGSSTEASGKGSPIQASGKGSPIQASGKGNPIQASGKGSPIQASGKGSPTQTSGKGNPIQASGKRSVTEPSGKRSPTGATASSKIYDKPISSGKSSTGTMKAKMTMPSGKPSPSVGTKPPPVSSSSQRTASTQVSSAAYKPAAQSCSSCGRRKSTGSKSGQPVTLTAYRRSSSGLGGPISLGEPHDDHTCKTSDRPESGRPTTPRRPVQKPMSKKERAPFFV